METANGHGWQREAGDDGGGFRVEDDFGKGNVRQRLKLHASILNPVLFQMVKPFMDKGSCYVYLEAVDFSKRYKDAVQAEEGPVEHAEDTEGGGESGGE